MAQANLQKTLSNVEMPFASYKSLHRHIDVREKSGQVVKMEANQALGINQVFQDLVFMPQTSVASTFFTTSAGQYVDIQIQAGEYIIQDLVVEVDVAETGGSASVTPIEAPLQFARIETWVNSGSSLSSTWYDVPIWFNYNFLSNEQLQNVQAVANMTNWLSPSAISASATAQYLVPLYGNIFATSGGGIYMGGLGNRYITVRLYGNSSVDAGTGVYSLQKLALHCRARVIPENQMAQLKREYETSTLELPFVDIAHQNWSQAFAASTSYTLPLSGINGSASFLLIGLRASVAAASNAIATFTALGTGATISILDSTGQLINSPTNEIAALLNHIDAAYWFPGTFFVNIPMYPVIFGDPVKANIRGQNAGTYYFDTRDQLQIQTGVGLSSATYQLDVYGYMLRHMHLKNGMFIVNKK